MWWIAKATLGVSTSLLRSALGACVRNLFGITVTSYPVRYNGWFSRLTRYSGRSCSV